MFVLDGSGSIGDANFESIKDWVLKITEEFDIDGGTVTVGVVQFSHWFKTRYYYVLNAHDLIIVVPPVLNRC